MFSMDVVTKIDAGSADGCDACIGIFKCMPHLSRTQFLEFVDKASDGFVALPTMQKNAVKQTMWIQNDTIEKGVQAAAAYMAKEFPPKAGGPKTVNSIADKWKACKKLHEHFLKIKEGVYVGASGWTYTDEGGFNVTDDTRDAWHNFVVDEIVPSHARGRYVFNAGATQADGQELGTFLGSRDDDNDTPPSDALTQSSDLSQPLSNWFQTNFDRSQTSDVPDPASSSQISTTQSTFQVARRIPVTPAPALKRAAAEDVEGPWSNKRSRTTSPESILALGRSVDGIGKVFENVFAPKKSSVMSPTKKVPAARKLALEDADGSYIAASDRTRLNIFFGWDTTAADAYISDEDPFLRAETARELLNPT
ncbi:hypothetical protein C8J57DRAFT_1542459 [Mycena rebaudengoi]|nr:hypothetical protein C8J57DRAFT_1542459 [Mycena rebaudengoi]